MFFFKWLLINLQSVSCKEVPQQKGFLKLTPVHASVIYQIPWIFWFHRIQGKFNSSRKTSLFVAVYMQIMIGGYILSLFVCSWEDGNPGSGPRSLLDGTPVSAQRCFLGYPSLWFQVFSRGYPSLGLHVPSNGREGIPVSGPMSFQGERSMPVSSPRFLLGEGGGTPT